MKSRKLLLFDLSGEYAHFRKFNTTTSPLTYAIPTRTALIGLLGAILGIERETGVGQFPEGKTPLCELFAKQRSWIAIQLLSPVKKCRIGFNLLMTGKSPSNFFNIVNRTQIEYEFLKDLRCRVYVGHEDAALFQELANRIRQRNFHFTPYLGLAQCVAMVDWVGEEEAHWQEAKAETYSPIHTALNLNEAAREHPIRFGASAHYVVDTMPMELGPDRIVQEYAEVIVERGGQALEAQVDHYWKTTQANIAFL
ncbi:MAG: type I-B CRISPR-associated protein Cas5b [Bacteroidota bacterium]